MSDPQDPSSETVQEPAASTSSEAPSLSTPKKPIAPRSRRVRILFFGCVAGLFFLLFILIFLAIAEAASRRFLSHCWGFTQADPVLGWINRAGYEGYAITSQRKWRLSKQIVRINLHHLRDREIPYEKPEGVYRILLVGDSFVEAMQVDLEDTFGKVMEETLNRGLPTPRFEVIDAGTGNYGTDQELLYYLKEGRKYKPDLVVLVVFPFNDFMDNSYELNGMAYEPKTFFHLENGKPVPDSSPRLPPNAERLRQLQNRWPVRKYGHFAFFNLGRHWAECYMPRFHEFMIRIGQFPIRSIETVPGQSMHLDICRTPLLPEWQNAVDLTAGLFEEFKKAVESDHARFRAVIVPFIPVYAVTQPSEVARKFPAQGYSPDQPERLVREIFQKRGVPFLDLTETLIETYRETHAELHIDGHFSPIAHRSVAKAILQFLSDLGDVPNSENRPETPRKPSAR